MIVKILDVDTRRWVFMDQVAQCTAGKAFLRQHSDDKEIVGLFHFEKPPKPSKGSTQNDTLRIDESFVPRGVIDKIRSAGGSARVSLIYLTMRGMGDIRVISFSSLAFLMNDEGKTIERL